MRRAIDLIHFVIREGMSPDQVECEIYQYINICPPTRLNVKYNNEDDDDNGKNVDDRSQP